MPEFFYKGQSIRGPMKGEIFANSRKLAQSSLRAQGIVPKSLQRIRRYKSAVFWIFIKTLSILLLQNIKLSDALEIMRKQQNRNVCDAASRVLTKLGDGASFSSTLVQVFQDLHPQTVQIIDIGVRNGGLRQAIKVIQDERNFAVKQKQELIKALSYPAFVLLFSLIALILIFDTVLPEFKSALQDIKLTPLQTIIMSASGKGYYLFIRIFWIGLSIVFVGHVISRYRPWMIKIGSLVDFIPVLKNIFKANSEAQFLHSLALSLRLKSDLTEACIVAARYVKNPHHQSKLSEITTALLEGKSFTVTLANTGLFNEMHLAQIEVAERSNKLAEIVVEMDQTLITQRALRMSLLSQIIGPLAIILLGIIIFLVAFVVVTPMMSLQNSIG